jgi:tagatose 6-phosphate kinase
MIVCLGTTPVYQRSMVFERLVPNGVNRAAAVHDYASGKSVNVARVLHTLGEDVVATGFVGRGGRGDALLADLDATGIRHDFVRVDSPARQCVTAIDRAAGTATELVEESGAVTAEDCAELARRLAALRPAARGWVMSGSLPPGAPDSLYAACLDLVGKGRPAILDARGKSLREAIGTPGLPPFVVKLNRDELAETVGSPVESDDAVRRAARRVAQGQGGAVITAGAGAVTVFDGERFWRVEPPPVEARSAVGSGDAFSAGVMVGLLRGNTLAEACSLGAACGAANALTDKAGFLSPADVEALLPRVRVERS